MTNLALFDLDSTLLMGDSDHAWGEFLVTQGQVDPIQYQTANHQFYQDYQAGTLNIDAFLNFSLAPLAKIPMAELKLLRDAFLKSILPDLIAPNIHEVLLQHQGAKDLCIIITATNDFITAPIAEHFDAALIATQAEFKDGRYTGKVAGIPCFSQNKITRLQAWLAAKQLAFSQFDTSFFYSDSINDLPLLELVDQPRVVNADKTLGQIAKSRNWPHLPHPE